jgi:microcystin-dependent protein
VSDPFLGEIRIFSIDYAPTGWATCDGQVVPIQQNTGLFSLIGVTYGGNGTTNFALPNLQGRLPIDNEAGHGLRPRAIGDKGGSETVSLTQNTVISHTHALMASPHQGTLNAPGAQNALSRSDPVNVYTLETDSNPGLAQLASNTLGPIVGGGQAHDNLMPSLVLTICIALNGEFPKTS